MKVYRDDAFKVEGTRIKPSFLTIAACINNWSSCKWALDCAVVYAVRINAPSSSSLLKLRCYRSTVRADNHRQVLIQCHTNSMNMRGCSDHTLVEFKHSQFGCCHADDPSPFIKLDQQKQEVDSMKILPLTPQVN